MSNLSTWVKRIIISTLNRRIHNYNLLKNLFANKYGLEIGGPSKIFRDHKYIPLYRIIKGLDGCNFSESTIWEGSLKQGKNYKYYKNRNGMQFISEATDLHLIPDLKYDFIISSNCLEHIANPLKAVEEWIRVIKNGGLILLVLPNKEFCFDHKRPFTEFSHLLNDYKNGTKEDDLTHLHEILDLHDLKMDKRAGSFKQFKIRSLKNYENRALHHHVFNLDILKSIFSYFKIEMLLASEGKEFVIVGRKT